MIAADDADAAEAAAIELEELAAGIGALYVRASALQAAGAVRLARGDAEAALPVLRDAWAAWQKLEVPYESAEARVLIGHACHGLGDVDTARSHYEAAAHTFERLGAAPALTGLGTSSAPPAATAAESRLTRRELEVIRLVATGRTNREIAAVLSISEHTVARHLSNVFDKLGVASRTAAATFAIERGLL